jgi:hypothetical protein
MKKLLSITLTIIMVLSAIIIVPTASAKQFKSGDYKYKILEDGTASITKYLGFGKNIKDIKIPDKIDGYKVTKVSNYALETNNIVTQGFPKLNSVVFPDSIITIGKYAINNCRVKSITLGKNVRYISNSPFSGVSHLKKIKLAKGNKYFILKNGVLFNKDMTKLLVYPEAKSGSKYSIPNGVKVISSEAFYSNENLKKVIFPYTLKTIGELAFTGSDKLESITIPNNVVSIGRGAFADCENITKITIIPNSKLKIYGGAFINVGVTSLVVPKVTGDNIFEDCKNLKKITISSKVKTITHEEFLGCSNLKTVTIPKTVTKIGKYSLGYASVGYYGYEKIKGFTIKGKKGSAAHKYAKSNGFKFVAV